MLNFKEQMLKKPIYFDWFDIYVIQKFAFFSTSAAVFELNSSNFSRKINKIFHICMNKK